MFIPDHHRNDDLSEIKAFLKANSFGILVSQYQNKPWATHIPLELEVNKEGKEVLTAHIAKANPQWHEFDKNEEVLCIFNGPHSYISSSWYKNEEVPTWDYIAVHVYGKLSILSEEEVMASMHRLVDKYEAHSKEPISLKKMSPHTLKQVKGVVGFEIEITDIQAQYKLSRNRKQDHPKIIAELEDTKNPMSIAIAKAIKKGQKAD